MAYKGMARSISRLGVRTRRRQYKMPGPVTGSLGRLLRRAGGGTSGAISRVHTFKRVAVPMVIRSAASGTLPTVLNGGSAPNFYCAVGNNSAGDVLSTSTFGGALSFALNQAAAINELTTLFDNYRIRKVVLRFDFSSNQAPSASSNASVNAVPLLHMTPDFDDATVPTTKVDVLQNGYCKTYRLDRPVYVSIVPRAQAVVTGQTGTAGGGLLPANSWLDCASSAIPHFGFKFWVDDFGDQGTSTCALRITPTYYLETKNVV